MKRIVTFFVMAMLLLGSAPTAAFATTTPATTSDLIAQLTAQIETLKAKIAELSAARAGVQSSAQDVRQTMRLLGDLKEGMSSEDVKLMQALLASDSEIYPEKIVSGYYGQLTKNAVKRFQKKHGISDTGYTGPLTRAKLNELLAGAPVSTEGDDEGDDSHSWSKSDEHRNNGKAGEHFCLSVPPGHLIAKGWLKKHEGDDRREGNDETTLPLCKKLPRGIEKQLGNGSTTPPVVGDVIAPTISTLTLNNVTTTGATLSWSTNESAQSKVYVSTVSPVATVTPAWMDSAYNMSHSMTLASLSASTTYYVLVSAKDASGNTSYSTTASFTTAPVVVADTTAPVISQLAVANIASTSSSITWTTDELASSKVYYGTTTPLDLGSALNVFVATPMTAHDVGLTGLSASSTYYVVVESADAANNVATSSQTSFTTL